MKTAGENKMVSPEKETKIENKQRFFYPDHQLMVEAGSKEEADGIKDEILAKEVKKS